ncbi:hypothetical protein F4677DRAFT_461534 [Hypoxylon crocopeplum]|nr:hypothetical protein F4677DRAFT_461534 [Hypoxylon crocopeplum]
MHRKRIKLEPDSNVEDGFYQDKAEAVKMYLREEITVDEAARAVTTPIEYSDNPEQDLERLWDFLVDSLMGLSSNYTNPLIELLRAIDGLPELEITAVKENKLPFDGKLWRGLPGFADCYAKARESDWYELAIKADSLERSRLRDNHVKKAAIEAVLVVLGIGGIPIDWGYETVADALEYSNALLDFQVPAAAEWLKIAGRRFREGAAKEEHSWAFNRQRDLLDAGNLMTLDRYLFWRKRLDDIRSQSEATVEAATAAVERIERELLGV